MSVRMISGQPLGQYLQTNLWAPLGMNDTGFYIPPEKAARYAKPLPNDPLSGKLQSVAPVLTEKLEIECGGGCATSTVTDYLRFALMLMHGGQGGEARILGPFFFFFCKTVEYMLSDQLGPKVTNLVSNADPTRADFGFGLGLAIKPTPGVTPIMGSAGSFSWPGASGTDWWVDPKEDLAVVYLSAAPGPSAGITAKDQRTRVSGDRRLIGLMRLHGLQASAVPLRVPGHASGGRDQIRRLHRGLKA